MNCVYTRFLNDDEMRAHLERGDSLVFKGLSGAWEGTEHQVFSFLGGRRYAVGFDL